MSIRRTLEIGYHNKQRLGFYKDAGDTTEVTITSWLKEVGDIIQGVSDPNTGNIKGEIIVEIDSDKGLIELGAEDWEVGARIVEILIPDDETVTISLKEKPLQLAILEVDGDEPSEEQSTSYEVEDLEPEESVSEISAEKGEHAILVSGQAREAASLLEVNLEELIVLVPSGTERIELQHVLDYSLSLHDENDEVLASPATRQYAGENNVSLADVSASGPHGIILIQDVVDMISDSTEEKSEISTEEFSEWDRETLAPRIEKPTKRRLAVARNLKRAKEEMVLVGSGFDINMGPLQSLRSEMKGTFIADHGMKLRFDHFFLAAVTKALGEERFERLNAKWEWLPDGSGQIVLFDHINLALAVASPEGLVTPVIKNCEDKTFLQIAKAAEELISKVAQERITVEELSGVTFTVNNTGAFGDEYPDPIPNPDTAAILAFGRARRGGAIPYAMMRLKFDHQILDGHEVGPFMQRIRELLEDPQQLLLLH